MYNIQCEADWGNRTEAMFSIFKIKKIDQNKPKLDNQKLIYTKSTT